MADLAETVATLRDSIRAGIRVAVVARVETYDAAQQTADVLPLARESWTVDGQQVEIEPVPARGVPVVWPGGGGRSLTMGLAKGDLVLLVIRHISHDEVDGGASKPLTPALARRLDMADAVALPVFVAPGGGQGRSDGQPALVMLGGEALHVGASTADRALALAQETKAHLDALQAAHDAHTHMFAGAVVNATPAAPGPVTASGTTGAASALVGPLGPIASTRVKVDA